MQQQLGILRLHHQHNRKRLLFLDLLNGIVHLLESAALSCHLDRLEMNRVLILKDVLPLLTTGLLKLPR